jgi:hypothetical protein
MDEKRFPTQPPGPSIRPLAASGPRGAQKLRKRTDDSPPAEYSTPVGSPTERNTSPTLAKSPQPSYPRGPHPSRPPRPSEVMPIQASKARQHVPSRTPPKSSDELAQYWERGSKASPKTTHGHSSDEGTSSEDVSSPSFSDPPTSRNTTPPSGTPRKAQFTAQSSSRRGPSLYAQGTSFSPILEESPDPSSKARASIASSRGVPSSWGSHPDDYKSSIIQKKIEDEEDEVRTSTASPNSNASIHDDTAGLVRQASLGKTMRPSITKIKHPSDNALNKRKEPVGLGAITAGVAAGAVGSSRDHTPTPPSRGSPTIEYVGNRTIIIDHSASNSRSSSQDSGKGSSTLVEPIERSRSPLASVADRSARQPASPLTGMHRPISKGPSTNEKVALSQRPAQLDMEAVRDSDTRASITSLPDLIRRATRLAANLDRGKTASRTGMLDIANIEKEPRRRSGSISDILASFPPPRSGTPEGTRAGSRWPSPFPSKLNQRMSYLNSHESDSTQVPRKGRRCCGVSLCTFILIMLLLAILIAAAIVLPVVLIVLPRQRQAAANDTGPSRLDHCPDSVPCQNGGISIVSDNTCRCICVNGFTGDRCTTVTDPGCTIQNVGTGAQEFSNATLGDAIPRLLTGASTNYSIPLNSSLILSLFSSHNMSCTSENDLVSFRGQNIEARAMAQKVAGAKTFWPSRAALPPLPTPTPRAGLSRRLEPRQIKTSEGIVFQATIAPSATAITSAASKSSTTASSSSSPSSFPPGRGTRTAETVDFARIAVLFVFEQTGQLNTAVQAQDSIEEFLLSRSNQSETMSLGADGVDLSLNFASFSISLGNGTELGGKGMEKGKGKGKRNDGLRDNKNKRRKRSKGSKNLWEGIG